MRVIGLMSGTSYDAIEAAAADLGSTADTLVLTRSGTLTAVPGRAIAARRGALPPPRPPSSTVCRLDTGIGQAFAEAARGLTPSCCGGRADLVVSHGQTVFHWVEDDARPRHPAARAAGLDRRAHRLPGRGRPAVRDIAAGGQGAPLVSLFDALLPAGRHRARRSTSAASRTSPSCAGRGSVAFDTGPANALLDAVVTAQTGARDLRPRRRRRRARHGARGSARRLLAEPYYAPPPPKSTGKELFHLAYVAPAAGADRRTTTCSRP